MKWGRLDSAKCDGSRFDVQFHAAARASAPHMHKALEVRRHLEGFVS
jgi:hypothetical protein